jgi:hypothetical protein
MRVLHLPVNIASFASHTVRGLRQIGVDARGLVFVNAPVQSEEALQVIVLASRLRKHYVMGQGIRWLYQYLKWAAWADVIHWYFGALALPWGLDLRYLKLLRKPGVVEWLGSDIRIPEIASEDNPYYAAAFSNGYEYRSESHQKSWQLQQRFGKAGFGSVASVGMLPYVHNEFFSQAYMMPQRLILSDYLPTYPDPHTTRPLLVHSSTASVTKGTSAVLKAIDQLKSQYFFQFQLIQGVSRDEALQIVQKADIFIDQFVLGDHGMAALEAMAFGKPVLCYIKPSMIDRYPSDCPIINANQGNLTRVIEPLLKDGHLRHEIGRRSRIYVEKHHDGVKLGYRLRDIYQEVISNRATKGIDRNVQ